jgi:hypothetical protein
MAAVPNTDFGLNSHRPGKTNGDKDQDRIKSAAGAVLLLLEAAVPLLALVLVVLSAIVSLFG